MEVVLYNRGKVDLDFCTMSLVDTPPDKLSPGEVTVLPLSGNVSALEHQKLMVNYLPGAPMNFNETIKIQVAHFQPDEITITGEAIFPRISFNVPRSMDGVDGVTQTQAKSNLDLSKELCHKVNVSVPASDGERDLTEATSGFQTEVERLLVKQFAAENFERLFGVVKRNPKLRYNMHMACIHILFVIHELCSVRKNNPAIPHNVLILLCDRVTLFD